MSAEEGNGSSYPWVAGNDESMNPQNGSGVDGGRNKEAMESATSDPRKVPLHSRMEDGARIHQWAWFLGFLLCR